MNKFLIYTSNLDRNPRSMRDVIKFAQQTPKFYLASVELSDVLGDVREGDNIITKKGNSIYVIRAISESVDDWSDETREYVEELSRQYGLKRCNITSIAQVVKFETWCKQGRAIINKTVKEKTMGSISNLSKSMFAKFMPAKAEGVRVSMDGNICVETSEGYVTIDANNKLESYPEEFTVDLPVFTICKSIDQLAVGDIIKCPKSYAKITKIEGEKLTAISFTGTGKVVHTIKDILFNQTTVRVVVSMVGNIGGQMNPMMMMALMDKESGSGKGLDTTALLAMMSMNQNGGNLGINPMMMMLMGGGDDKSSLKDLLLMSAMTGGNGFNMFQGFGGMQQGPAKPAAEVKPEGEGAAE